MEVGCVWGSRRVESRSSCRWILLAVWVGEGVMLFNDGGSRWDGIRNGGGAGMIKGGGGGRSAQCREHGARGGLKIYHEVSSGAFHGP